MTSSKKKQIKSFKTINQHSFSHNSLHVKLLHTYLNDIADDEKLKELSTQPILIQKLNFGKYKGRFIEEIAMNDRAYLIWVLNSVDTLDVDMRYSIENYTKQ